MQGMKKPTTFSTTAVALNPEFEQAAKRGFSDIAAAGAQESAARRLLCARTTERDSEDAELAALEAALDLDDAVQLQRAVTLRLRQPLWERKLLELERLAFVAEDKVNAGRARVLAALREACLQQKQAAFHSVRDALAPLADDRAWIEAAASHFPNACSWQRLELLCDGPIEAALGLSLPDICAFAARGELPPLPALPNPLQAAALAHLGNLPFPNY